MSIQGSLLCSTIGRSSRLASADRHRASIVIHVGTLSNIPHTLNIVESKHTVVAAGTTR